MTDVSGDGVVVNQYMAHCVVEDVVVDNVGI